MSEFINNSDVRVKKLLELFTGIMEGKNAPELIKKHKESIENATPHDMLSLTDIQLKMNVSTKEIKKDIDKVINVLYETLSFYNWKKPEHDTFIYFLMEENKELKKRLENMKKLLIQNDFINTKNIFLNSFKDLMQIENHYVKKENILFPYLEKKLKEYRPLSVMWSIHDDIRKNIKKIIAMLENENTDEMDFKIEVGKIFFLLFGMIQKEELILFPVATEVLSGEELYEMHMQSFEYEFSFIKTPEQPERTPDNLNEYLKDDYVIKSETGEMTAEQTLMVLNKLPLDITFVDENDRVRFFSKPEERFFPRSPAIIGREVKNCHPPESVHIVEEIVDAFKKGEKDSATFWINMKGKFILIQYFAIRTKNGEYKGVIETSQDVTEIRSLEGEQRLLNWKNKN